MSRRSARFALALTFLALVGGVVGGVTYSMWKQRARQLGLDQLDFLPETAQRIEDFHRVKLEGDRKVWEISAHEARYLRHDDEVVVSGPRVSFYLDRGGKLSLRAREGRIFVRGKALRRVELNGGVELSIRGWRVKTEGAVYDRRRNRVSTLTPVAIAGRRLNVRGQRMEVALDQGMLRISGDVRTTLGHVADEEGTAVTF